MNINDFLADYVRISVAIFKCMKRYFEENYPDIYLQPNYSFISYIDNISVYNGVNMSISIEKNRRENEYDPIDIEILYRKKYLISWEELNQYIDGEK